MEGSHAGSRSTTTRRKYISDSDILNELGVKVDAGIYSLENIGEDKVGLCILRTLERIKSGFVSLNPPFLPFVIAERRAETMTTSSSRFSRRRW